MKRSSLSVIAVAVLAALSFDEPPIRAQDQEPAPKPAARAYSVFTDPVNQDDAKADQSVSGIAPDTRPLTGIQYFTLGTPQSRHSYWVPGFQYASTIVSSPLNGSPSSGWYANNYFVGDLSLLDQWSQSQLSLNYSGGGFVSTDKATGNGSYQQFGATHTSNWGRWQLQFMDQFSYLPETQFGFGGATNLGVPGVGGSLAPTPPGLVGSVAPNQTIFSSVGPRYSNAFATQSTYAFTRRTSITMAGSYGILRFVDSGNVNSDNLVGNVGFNYVLTAADSIGVFYRFSSYHYSGNPEAIGDHTVNFAYGRKISGRLALQLSGGPEITTFRVPIGTQTHRISGSGSAALTYAIPRGGLSLRYSHGIGGGSGVLIGSDSDQVTLGWDYQVSRMWRATASFGFARNANLASGILQNSQSYDSWFITAGLTRPLGPSTNFSLGYTALIQRLGACPAGTCTASYTQHEISLGFRWNTRPFVIH